MTGVTYTVAPIPPDAEHTTWVDAGAISIGVEYPYYPKSHWH